MSNPLHVQCSMLIQSINRPLHLVALEVGIPQRELEEYMDGSRLLIVPGGSPGGSLSRLAAGLALTYSELLGLVVVEAGYPLIATRASLLRQRRLDRGIRRDVLAEAVGLRTEELEQLESSDDALRKAIGPLPWLAAPLNIPLPALCALLHADDEAWRVAPSDSGLLASRLGRLVAKQHLGIRQVALLSDLQVSEVERLIERGDEAARLAHRLAAVALYLHTSIEEALAIITDPPAALSALERRRLKDIARPATAPLSADRAALTSLGRALGYSYGDLLQEIVDWPSLEASLDRRDPRDRIQELRERCGWNLVELQEYSGLSLEAIGNRESQAWTMHKWGGILYRLAGSFGLTLEELLDMMLQGDPGETPEGRLKRLRASIYPTRRAAAAAASLTLKNVVLVESEREGRRFEEWRRVGLACGMSFTRYLEKLGLVPQKVVPQMARISHAGGADEALERRSAALVRLPAAAREGGTALAKGLHYVLNLLLRERGRDLLRSDLLRDGTLDPSGVLQGAALLVESGLVRSVADGRHKTESWKSFRLLREDALFVGVCKGKDGVRMGLYNIDGARQGEIPLSSPTTTRVVESQIRTLVAQRPGALLLGLGIIQDGAVLDDDEGLRRTMCSLSSGLGVPVIAAERFTARALKARAISSRLEQSTVVYLQLGLERSLLGRTERHNGVDCAAAPLEWESLPGLLTLAGEWAAKAGPNGDDRPQRLAEFLAAVTTEDRRARRRLEDAFAPAAALVQQTNATLVIGDNWDECGRAVYEALRTCRPFRELPMRPELRAHGEDADLCAAALLARDTVLTHPFVTEATVEGLLRLKGRTLYPARGA